MELRCRRLELGLSQEDFSWVLEHISGQTTRQVTVSRWEQNDRDIPSGVVEDLDSANQVVENLTASYLASADRQLAEQPETDRVDGVVLWVPLTEDEWWAREPSFKGLPVPLVQVAAAKARGRLVTAGVVVRIQDVVEHEG
jgi:transcriptional regulator with XRE-family HTH domain